ncbi:hypothetical protein RND81_06G160000 [Saponaria officinalis]|uniref:Uncharacterized protein n=1 Tax=Saponaria officinalis TaxID=3572 RepID=A0AAW1KCD8_SAPOF
MGNDQRSGGSSSTSSSKKNKSNSNSNNNSSNSSSSNNNSNSNIEKPKQPQRGLGVAQLEKIRLHSQMASCGFYPQPHHGFPNPFPSTLFPHVNDHDMRLQAGYQVGLLQSSSSPPIGYGIPSNSSSPYGYHHPNNFMMGVGEQMERTCNIRFGESHPSMTTRWNPNGDIVMATENNNQYIQPQGLVTRHLLSHVEVCV